MERSCPQKTRLDKVKIDLTTNQINSCWTQIKRIKELRNRRIKEQLTVNRKSYLRVTNDRH